MSEKKYLVTKAELLDFMEGFGNLMIRKLGIDDAVKAQNPRIDDEWLEAHEYRESTLYTHSCPCGARRTCHDALKDRYPGEDTTGYWECSECGYELGDCDPPNFCPDCGLRVKE